MKHLKQLSTIATATGLGLILVSGVTGCTTNSKQQEAQEQTQNAFVIIEEIKPGQYVIKDEFPAEETRIVLKQLDGNERVLTKTELDTLMKEENAKIDNGTSNLTKDNTQISQQGGMGLGEVVLSSIAGAMIGSWIGSKLFGNQNFQNNRKAGYKSPSTYSKSKKSFSKSSQKRSTKRKGFFGSKKSSRRSRGFFGG